MDSQPGAAGTPLDAAPPSIAAGRRLWLKREDLHELGSFKWRGAIPALAHYRRLGFPEVVTASTGNHGAAVAWAARREGMRATIYAPVGASLDKLSRIRECGGDVRLVGRDLDEAKGEGRLDAGRRGLAFFEDGSEPAQEAGYAALGAEILAQMPEGGSIIVPVGNGALICGIGAATRESRSPVRLIGAVAREAPVMAMSFEARRVVECDRMNTFADGLAVRVAIPSAVEKMIACVNRVELVSEREIAAALGIYARAGIRAEGAAGAALAAALRAPDPEPTVVLVTGRNIDEIVYRRAVEESTSFPD